MLSVHKKIWLFLRISASAQFASLDFKVSHKGVQVNRLSRLSSHQKITFEV
jgi:hypothetical protein